MRDTPKIWIYLIALCIWFTGNYPGISFPANVTGFHKKENVVALPPLHTASKTIALKLHVKVRYMAGECHHIPLQFTPRNTCIQAGDKKPTHLTHSFVPKYYILSFNGRGPPAIA